MSDTRMDKPARAGEALATGATHGALKGALEPEGPADATWQLVRLEMGDGTVWTGVGAAAIDSSPDSRVVLRRVTISDPCTVAELDAELAKLVEKHGAE